VLARRAASTEAHTRSRPKTLEGRSDRRIKAHDGPFPVHVHTAGAEREKGRKRERREAAETIPQVRRGPWASKQAGAATQGKAFNMRGARGRGSTNSGAKRGIEEENQSKKNRRSGNRA